MSDVETDAHDALASETVVEDDELVVDEPAEVEEVEENGEDEPVETQEEFGEEEAAADLAEPAYEPLPEEMPTITTFKTRFAPSKSRLDTLLNTVQANSIPVLPDSSEYLEYPRPKEDIESSSDTTMGEQLTTLSPAAYWKRVDSFTSFGWFGKPVAVSPLECARFGWALHSTDTLRCTFCKKQLIYQSTDPSQLVTYTQQFTGLFQSAHDEECPFKSKSVSTAVHTIQSRPSSILVAGFYERLYLLRKSCINGGELGHSDLNLDVSSLLKYGNSNGVDLEAMPSRIPGEMPRSLIYLALCGWTADVRSKPSPSSLSSSPNSATSSVSIRCLYCRRNLNASSSPPSSSGPSDSADAPPAKRSKTLESIPVDPLQDHKLHCPWVTIVPGEQHLGWQFSLRAIVISLQSNTSSTSTETPKTPSEVADTSNSTSLRDRLSRTLKRVQSLADM